MIGTFVVVSLMWGGDALAVDVTAADQHRCVDIRKEVKEIQGLTAAVSREYVELGCFQHEFADRESLGRFRFCDQDRRTRHRHYDAKFCSAGQSVTRFVSAGVSAVIPSLSANPRWRRPQTRQ